MNPHGNGFVTSPCSVASNHTKIDKNVIDVIEILDYYLRS